MVRLRAPQGAVLHKAQPNGLGGLEELRGAHDA